MSRLLSLIAAGIVGAALAMLVAVGWWRGAIALPFGPSHHELAMQLRDRGTVAVAGGVPLGLPRDAAPLVDFDQFPALRSALRGNRGAQAAQAMRDAHLDGLLVRTDHTLSSSGSLLRALSTAQPVDELAATYLDDTAALYEVHDPISIAPGDAPRLIEVVRLVLEGAVPPPERLFPESARRAVPTEVAVVIRDGHEPILWRAVRGGSIARALIDATYAVLDRWNTRQQQSYGPLRRRRSLYLSHHGARSSPTAARSGRRARQRFLRVPVEYAAVLHRLRVPRSLGVRAASHAVGADAEPGARDPRPRA